MKCFHSYVCLCMIHLDQVCVRICIISRQGWTYEVFLFICMSVHDPFGSSTCAYLYHIKTRLEHMKCFHSYVYMCMIHLDQVRVRICIIWRQAWTYEVFLFICMSVHDPFGSSTCANLYHMKTGLNIWSVSIHMYVCAWSIWIKYVCVSVSSKDRLGHMKSFYSYVCLCMIHLDHVCVRICIISRQAWAYEVFPFICIGVHHPFGSVAGAIQTHDAYVS